MKGCRYFLAGFLLFLFSCDPGRLYEDYRTIPGNRWFYKNKLAFDVQVKDTARLYNLFVNLRIDGDYRYSNIFLWLYETGPGKKTEKTRVEFQLADERGKWLGSGLGDIYDYSLPVRKHIKFPGSGFYRFDLEQNMRDDTLAHVKAVGIRVEAAE